MDAEATAILFQGFQKEFCEPDGLLYDLVSEQLRERMPVERILELLEGVAELGLPVYMVPIIFTPDYRELVRPTGILAAIKERGAFRKGNRGVELIERLAPYREKIRILSPKRGLCAFSNTELHQLLRENGIKTLALAGILTNLCVESTGRTAYDLGFQVVFLTDCMAAKSEAEQRASEQFIFPLLGETMSSSDFLSRLRQGRAKSAAGARAP